MQRLLRRIEPELLMRVWSHVIYKLVLISHMEKSIGFAGAQGERNQLLAVLHFQCLVGQKHAWVSGGLHKREPVLRCLLVPLPEGLPRGSAGCVS